MHIHQVVEKGEALKNASRALIVLHGRGATAADILTLADAFPLEDFYIVAPQATNHSWYPQSFMAPRASNEPWLTSAIQLVQGIMEDISKKIPYTHMYIMGFSQGACLALETTARNAKKYGGIIAFTGGLIGPDLQPTQYTGDFQETPVFLSNGDHDMHIPLQRTQDTAKLLQEMGAAVDLHIFHDRPHTILEDEINLVKKIFF